MSIKSSLVLFALLIGLHLTNAQQRLLKGIVLDSTRQAIEFTNLMGKSLNNDAPFLFNVTDDKGKFEIRLKNNTTYLFTVSFMGYQPQTFVVDSIKKPAYQTIILKPSKQALDEVVIDYKTPMKITKDSIVYNVKHFTNGKERKLKAVLKKLPGVSVDKNVQISVMGKQISKVMVEGKDFFGGNSRLAVDNIPADAVKSVQVLKDYSAVSFMKGLTDEQKMIINIKLKKGKKRFVFGDITGGGNTNKNYLGKANMFFYSPKTNMNYIGNANNTGENSLGYQDINRFESNHNYLNQKFLANTGKQQLMHFTQQEKFTAKKTLFNAGQWQQDFGKNWQFQIYALQNRDKINSDKQWFNDYLSPSTFEQHKSKKQDLQPQYFLSKLNVVYNPKANQYLDLSISVSQNEQNLKDYFMDTSPYGQNYVNNLARSSNLQWHSGLIYYHKFSKKHIIRLVNNWSYEKQNTGQNWQSNTPFLSPFINMQTASQFNLQQVQDQTTRQWQILLKYYFKINAHNHLYFSLGNSLQSDQFDSNLLQETDNENVYFNDFKNNLLHTRNNLFTGVQYRFKIGQSIFTPGIYAYKLFWHLKQNTPVLHSEYLFLPEFNLSTKWFKGDFNFKYNIDIHWPKPIDFTFNKSLKSYDQVFQGNANLSYGLAHHFMAHYNYYSLTKGLMIFTNIDLTKHKRQIFNKTQLAETAYFKMPILFTENLNTLTIATGINKEWRKIELRYHPFISYDQSVSWLNNRFINSDNWLWINNFSIVNNYKNWPDFSIDLQQMILNSHSDLSTYKLIEYRPSLSFDHTYKNWQLKTEYYIKYTLDNKQFLNTGQSFNISLRYQKPDNAFGVSIDITNVLNQKYIQSFTNTPYLISRQTTYLQPRIWLLKVHYKL